MTIYVLYYLYSIPKILEKSTAKFTTQEIDSKVLKLWRRGKANEIISINLFYPPRSRKTTFFRELSFHESLKYLRERENRAKIQAFPRGHLDRLIDKIYSTLNTLRMADANWRQIHPDTIFEPFLQHNFPEY